MILRVKNFVKLIWMKIKSPGNGHQKPMEFILMNGVKALPQFKKQAIYVQFPPAL